MNIKQINNGILILSNVLNLLFIIYLGVLGARFVWWVINPSTANVYIQKSSSSQYKDSVKYIINRYPFGVIVAPPKPKIPDINASVKLTGVYASMESTNSIAFIEVSDSPKIVKVGDTVVPDETLLEINESNIILLYQDQKITINLSTGSGKNMQSGGKQQDIQYTRSNNSSTSDGSSRTLNHRSRSKKSSAASTTDEASATQGATTTATANVPEEIKAKRKKYLDNFLKRQASTPQ